MALGGGTTANVSAGGVFFLTADWHKLRVGQSMALSLSGLSGYGAGPLFRNLKGKVTILRLELPVTPKDAYARAGVAARFDTRPRVEVYRLTG